MTRIFTAMRLLLGAAMLLSGINHFLGVVPLPEWHDPLALQLMTAFDHSGLLGVAKAIHLVGGALLLSNRLVPFALAALLPVNVCAFYIAVVLEGAPVGGSLALLILALNGLLMLARLEDYRGVLQPGALAIGEGAGDGENYSSLFVQPLGTVPRAKLAAGIATLAAAIAFYYWIVPFANGDYGLMVLVFPLAVLVARTIQTFASRSAS